MTRQADRDAAKTQLLNHVADHVSIVDKGLDALSFERTVDAAVVGTVRDHFVSHMAQIVTELNQSNRVKKT